MTDLSGLKILIIDDTDELLKFHETWMVRFKVEPVKCPDGKGGIEYFTNHPDVDLVILDLNLPDLHGKDVFVRLREVKPDIPIIISSGYGDDCEGLDDDFLTGVLQKPFFLPAMIEMIAGLTGR